MEKYLTRIMQRNRFLVTGATGFIGRALSLELARRGHYTHCAVRSRCKASGLPGQVIVVGDIDQGTDWSYALDGVSSVIHLGARVHVMQEISGDELDAFREVNLEGTKQLARAAVACGVKRLVYVSSIGVHGSYTDDKPFTEVSIPAPYSPYTVSKYEAEQFLFEVACQTDLEVVVVRPPLVYGPGNPGNFLRLIKLVKRGFPLPLSSVRNRRSIIYLGNIVDALITCVQHPRAAGNTYLVSDDGDVSTAQLIRDIARLINRPARLWPLPPALLRLAGRIAGKSSEVDRLVRSLQIDSTKIRNELGWSPPYSTMQGLTETAEWFNNKA